MAQPTVAETELAAELAGVRAGIAAGDLARKAEIEAMTVELEKEKELAKKHTERMEAMALKIASFGVSEVVKGMGMPKLFAVIREQAKNDKLDDFVILTAIGEAAGMTGFTVAKAVKKAAAKATGPKTPEAAELKAASLKAIGAKKKQETAEKKLAKAKSEGKPQPELSKLKAEAEAAKAQSVAAKQVQLKLRQRNADLKAAKKKAAKAVAA